MTLTFFERRLRVGAAVLAVVGGTAMAWPALAAGPGDGAAAKGPRGAMQRMFTAADSNQDGVLDQAEIDAFKRQQAASVDTDKDGVISAAELTAWRSRLSGERAQRSLARFDADRDGKVTTAEFEAAGDRMVARLDTNKDGMIEASELPKRGARADRGPRPAQP